MSYSVSLMKQLDAVEPQLRTVLWTILEEIEQHRESSVTKHEFVELKNIVADQVKIQAETREIVKQLAEAQQRTEARVEQLAEAQQRTEAQMQRTDARIEQLAEAQQRTEARVEQLAEAQQRTEAQMQRTDAHIEQLAEAQQRTEEQISILTGQMQGVRGHLGGLSKSVAYALENEAYRKLPRYLRNQYEITVQERLIRTTIGGREINLFAHATRAERPILIVGESVLRLNDMEKLKQLYEQVETVQAEFDGEVVPLIITHFATPELLAKTKAKGILVVQSYEWDFD